MISNNAYSVATQSNFAAIGLAIANVQCTPGIWGQMYLHNHSKHAAPRA